MVKSRDKKMSQARLEPYFDTSKKPRFFVIPERLGDIVVNFIKIGIVVCLVASISLAIHSAFSKQYRWFPLPEHIHVLQNASVSDGGPTNISHILFGIGGSASTWRTRSDYSKLWWDPNTTRGFAWLDEKPAISDPEGLTIPYQISQGWTQFRTLHSPSAVRIARIVYDSFKLGLPNVRWFVMGDDDTVFFTKNLVTVLKKYDHNEMYYIGGNSESVEQDVMHSYDMAFGGGGFAISYALAAQLARMMDGCLQRYFYFYGSDQRVWACVHEVGVPLTREGGFHQLDIRGDAYGLLAAHPMAPLVTLHHLDELKPVIPKHTRMDALKMLMAAYQLDPARIVQQSLCYDHNRKWSISISWGYTIQIYRTMLSAADLRMPLQTFKTWRSWGDGPFTFNTRPMSPDPCQNPAVFFLDHVSSVGTSGTVTVYKRFVPEEGEKCNGEDNTMEVTSILVSALKMDPEYWKDARRRQCCQIMDGGSIQEGRLNIRIRKCRPHETVTI
ncbi:uncharacterized protein LOC130969138 isoform X1 [Arachis stenosperma]|uniref:uncharacterized protein LOC130969138 isoform X1 n=2 Tax=Arachis stenosperma TaxID=217475 RepID=UPI0025AC5CBF|nr:uncharacterized protein LOC130969138 isoform X1 [Arachis stenosperma]